MRLISSAENSTLNWRAQYRYIQDIHDGRGYTGGIVGFTSGTGDMLAVVTAYRRARPGNPLARFIPALRRVNGGSKRPALSWTVRNVTSVVADLKKIGICSTA